MNTPPPDGHELAARSGTREVELIISTLLRTGVTLSILIILAGILVSFFHHPQYLYDPAELRRLTLPGAAFPRSLAEVAAGVAELRGQAIITAGLLVLLITPVLRVAVSIFAFLFERDWRFAAITTAVLMFLLLSFVLGRIE